ncbi:hypothetical protein GYA19_03170 [Candidatus Beckwithbacteria bacterium]|nr:hypothetical protein [Candidatus Beckwithbacteria bacterium]
MSSWQIYTIAFIINLLILYIIFWRYSKKQEKNLEEFLASSKDQLLKHKEEAHAQASIKVNKAFSLIKRLQNVSKDLEENVQNEYEEIIAQAEDEKQKIIEKAEQKAQEILDSADAELEQYKEERKEEVEKQMARLVMEVTEKVIEKTFDYQDHLEMIEQALEEVKQSQSRL